MLPVWTWVSLFWANFIEPCFCSALTLNSPTVDPCGSCRCGLTHTFLRLLLNCILPLFNGFIGRLGCTPSTLKKSLLIQPASNSSVTCRRSGHLKITSLSRPSSMVLKTSKVSRTKVSLGVTLRGVPASIRGIW